jgi:hypothetical protein
MLYVLRFICRDRPAKLNDNKNHWTKKQRTIHAAGRQEPEPEPEPQDTVKEKKFSSGDHGSQVSTYDLAIAEQGIGQLSAL